MIQVPESGQSKSGGTTATESGPPAHTTRWLTATIALICALVLVACGSPLTPTPTPSPPIGWTIELSPSAEAQLQVPGGPLISVPNGVVSKAGTLEVAALPATIVTKAVSAGATGWSLSLKGADLIGTVELSFPIPSGQPDPLVGFTDDDGKLVAVQGQRRGDRYVVQTDHFSNWFTQAWDWLLQQARASLDKLYSAAAQGKQPSCKGEGDFRALGVRVTSDDGNRVLWCAGTESKTLGRLKVTNARSYAVTAEYTPGLELVSRSSLLSWMPSLSSLLDKPTKKANKLTLIAPGETVEFTVSATPAKQGVMVQPSVAAYLASAFVFAVETVSGLRSWVGGKLDKIQQRISLSCAAQFLKTRLDNTPENSWEAQEYLHGSLNMALDCVQGQITKELGGNWLMEAFINVASWLWSGIKTTLNGFGAAADTALNPAGYRILLDLASVRPQTPKVDVLIAAGVCSPDSTITGQTSLAHPKWGASLLLSCQSKAPNEQSGLAVVDGRGQIRWTYRLDGTYYSLYLPDPGSDKSGNLFAIYDPGRLHGVAIFRPSAQGLKRLAGFYDYGEGTEDNRFYSAELRGPGKDGRYVIRKFTNDCDPSCAEGTTTAQDFVWTGEDYEPR